GRDSCRASKSTVVKAIKRRRFGTAFGKSPPIAEYPLGNRQVAFLGFVIRQLKAALQGQCKAAVLPTLSNPLCTRLQISRHSFSAQPGVRERRKCLRRIFRERMRDR